MAAIERGDGGLQRAHGRIAAPAIDIFLVMAGEGVERGENDGRAAIDRRVDETMLGAGIAAQRQELRVLRQIRLVILSLACCHQGIPRFQILRNLSASSASFPALSSRSEEHTSE